MMNPTTNFSMLTSCIPSLYPSSPLLIARSQTLTLTPHPHLNRPSLFKPHRPTGLLSSSHLISPPPFSSSPNNPTIAASTFDFDDLIEKDWSFLDVDSTSDQARRIITAAKVQPESRVLVSMGTAGFVDQLVEFAPCELLMAIHESLLALAMIKEKHDNVRCWQGGVDVVPERFTPFDVVFLCYLPGMGVSLDQIFRLLAARCSPGARLVISFDQGKDVIEQHRRQFPDMVTSELPDRTTLEKVATAHTFLVSEFVEESTFYLAVLRYPES